MFAADALGGHGDTTDAAAFAGYRAAFEAIAASTSTDLFVARLGGRVVATYQLIVTRAIAGRGAGRAIIEGVQVAPGLRGAASAQRWWPTPRTRRGRAAPPRWRLPPTPRAPTPTASTSDWVLPGRTSVSRNHCETMTLLCAADLCGAGRCSAGDLLLRSAARRVRRPEFGDACCAHADRALLLADAERLEDLHHARGVRAALHACMPVNIAKGEQFKPEFLAISPNNRMPAIVDPDGPGGEPISVFESGAILQYLGRKTGKFYPADERDRVEVEQWLFWQMGGLGPMAGQAHHFRLYAPEKIALRHHPLHQRGEPPLWRDEQAPRRPRIPRRRVLDRRHRLRRLGQAAGSGRARTSRSSRTSSAGSTR